MKAIGYIRLSFKDQSKYSLEAQEAAIKAYCIKHHLELVALFKDNGQRSSTFDRLDFKALESFVKKNKGVVKYLIVLDHDRFSRNLSEALSKINQLESSYHLKVLSVDESLDLDTSDPGVFISRAFKYATANAELLNIRVRTKRGIKNAQLQGRFANKAPYGYRNGRDFSDKSILILITEEAKIIRQLFYLYLSGLSISEVTLQAKDLGFPNKGQNAIGRLLGNCIYAGLIRVVSADSSVKYIKAIHEPIVSEADFWLVHELRTKKQTLQLKSKHDFPLKGLLKCYCGKYMTAGWSKGKSKYYLYYHCKLHRALNVPGIKIHEQFERLLKNLKLSSVQLSYLNKTVEGQLNLALVDSEQYIHAREKQLNELIRKIENLEEHFINNNIDVITFRKWSERYGTDRVDREKHIKYLQEENRNLRIATQQFAGKLENIYQIYHQSQSIQKRVLLKQIFRYGFTYVNNSIHTYRICSSLEHNNSFLKQNVLIGIEENETVSSEAEEGKFMECLTTLVIEITTINPKKLTSDLCSINLTTR